MYILFVTEKTHTRVYGMKFQCQRFRCIKGIKRIESNRIKREKRAETQTQHDVGATAGF